MGYQIYADLTSKAINVYLRTMKVPKAMRHRPEVRRQAFAEVVAGLVLRSVQDEQERMQRGAVGMIIPVDLWVCGDEAAAGRVTYFVEDPALLDVLWNANMQVTLGDLDFSKIPRVLSVAWPTHVYRNAPMQGVLVSFDSHRDAHIRLQAWIHSILGYEPFKLMPEALRNTVRRIWLSARLPDGAKRWGMDEVEVAKHMDVEEFSTRIMDASNYAGGTDMLESLTKDDAYQGFVMSRLVLRLLVYMQARPDLVRDGAPEGFKGQIIGETYRRVGLLERVRVSGGTHESPTAHWRIEHFRRYPIKDDGTRKLGAVHVRGTLVNLEGRAKTVQKEDGDGEDDNVETAAADVRGQRQVCGDQEKGSG